MKILPYESIRVIRMWASPSPGFLTRDILDVTMKKDPSPSLAVVSAKTIRFLLLAEHTEVLEHNVISFRVEGCSRSLLAQLTRHRIASYTSSSQHYQNYNDYPDIVHMDLCDDSIIETAIDLTNTAYLQKIDEGIPKEEARQILTNSKAVNLYWTINASSLYNFFRKRMCLRNVREMQIFAEKVWEVTHTWWPNYALVVGPPCHINGKCNQGYMTCKKSFNHPINK